MLAPSIKTFAFGFWILGVNFIISLQQYFSRLRRIMQGECSLIIFTEMLRERDFEGVFILFDAMSAGATSSLFILNLLKDFSCGEVAFIMSKFIEF